MEKDELCFCEECGGHFDLGDGEHINNKFTCHRCFHMKDYIHRNSVEYLCEIAFFVGGESKRIPVEYNDRVDSMTYEDWFSFYKYIYDYCKSIEEKISILELIYRTVKNGLPNMFAEFLSSYKK